MALSPNQSPAEPRSGEAAERVCAAREERRKDWSPQNRRAPAKALPLRGEGGMTEWYEKSPDQSPGFLNRMESIPTWCPRRESNPRPFA